MKRKGYESVFRRSAAGLFGLLLFAACAGCGRHGATGPGATGSGAAAGDSVPADTSGVRVAAADDFLPDTPVDSVRYRGFTALLDDAARAIGRFGRAEGEDVEAYLQLEWAQTTLDMMQAEGMRWRMTAYRLAAASEECLRRGLISRREIDAWGKVADCFGGFCSLSEGMGGGSLAALRSYGSAGEIERCRLDDLNRLLGGKVTGGASWDADWQSLRRKMKARLQAELSPADAADGTDPAEYNESVRRQRAACRDAVKAIEAWLRERKGCPAATRLLLKDLRGVSALSDEPW